MRAGRPASTSGAKDAHEFGIRQRRGRGDIDGAGEGFRLDEPVNGADETGVVNL